MSCASHRATSVASRATTHARDGGMSARARDGGRLARAEASARRRMTVFAGKRRGINEILDDEFNERAKEEAKAAKATNAGARNEGKAREPWIKVGNVSDVEAKPIKALILANGNFCMVRAGSMIFITACNSTAYQYPLIDGEIFEGALGAAIRTPLDGTSYDLATGQVLEWCPQDNLMRKFLGTLKKTAAPVPLPVYPTKVDDKGDVFTYFIEPKVRNE